MQLLKVDTLEQAREKLIQAVGSDWLKVCEVAVEDARDKVLAEDIYGVQDIPEFRRSMVDGYAVQAKDTMGASDSIPVFLEVIEDVAIGTKAQSMIVPGTCAYVPTGGMLPEGADSCVMVEYCEQFDKTHIAVSQPVSPGRHIVDIGEDSKKGALIFKKGRRLRPQEVGALAAEGLTKVKVYAPLSVFVISTGDELVTPGEELPIGKIYDINTQALTALARKHGFFISSTKTVPDVYEALRGAIEEAQKISDIVVISGGSSKGKKDITAQLIDELSEPGVFTHGLALKPGKPTILGMDKKSHTLMVGLPGHPVAAMAVFEMLPVWLKKELEGEAKKLLLPAVLDGNVPGTPGRKMLLFVELTRSEDGYQARPIFGKSGLMSTMTRADGYAVVDLNQEGLKSGDKIWVAQL